MIGIEIEIKAGNDDGDRCKSELSRQVPFDDPEILIARLKKAMEAELDKIISEEVGP